jgi:AcrR family transcriptional regulator
MPKATFLNLPADKRERFLALALEEFAEHDYAGASVSRLVARAGIAKGSVYQYFTDKEDLFLHLVEHAQGVMLATVHTISERTRTDGGLLGLLRVQMSASLQAALTHPREARLIQRAYQAPPGLRRTLERHDAQVRIQHMLGLVREAQAKGELAADLDPEVVAHMLAALLGGLGPLVMQRLGLDPARDTAVPAERLDPAVLEPLFDSVMRVVTHGLHG